MDNPPPLLVKHISFYTPLFGSLAGTSLCPHVLSPVPYSAEVTLGRTSGSPPRKLGRDEDSGRKTGQCKGTEAWQGSPGWQARPSRVALLPHQAVREFCFPLTPPNARPRHGASWACQRNKSSSSGCRAHQAPTAPLLLPVYPEGCLLPIRDKENKGQGE